MQVKMRDLCAWNLAWSDRATSNSSSNNIEIFETGNSCLHVYMFLLFCASGSCECDLFRCVLDRCVNQFLLSRGEGNCNDCFLLFIVISFCLNIVR